MTHVQLSQPHSVKDDIPISLMGSAKMTKRGPQGLITELREMLLISFTNELKSGLFLTKLMVLPYRP